MRYAATGFCLLRSCLLLAGLLSAEQLPAEQPPAVEPHHLRISVDTGPNHLRNQTIARFIALLQERTPDIETTLYPSGQLSRDRDIPKALHWGYVDMGVVAYPKLTPFVVDMNLPTIPSGYGLSSAHIHALADGDIGRQLNAKLERLGVKVLGKSIDLGFVNTYTSERAIRTEADYRGLKLRATGSNGQLALLEAFGANAIVLPFSDIPLALAQGSLDGLLTTHETVASAKLWEFGLRYCYEAQANFIYYIPIVSRRFWDALDLRLQQLVAQTWDEVAADSRRYARRRQATARAVLLEHGMECTRAKAELLPQQRRKLQPVSQRMVERLGMDQQLYRRMLRAVAELEREAAP